MTKALKIAMEFYGHVHWTINNDHEDQLLFFLIALGHMCKMALMKVFNVVAMTT